MAKPKSLFFALIAIQLVGQMVDGATCSLDICKTENYTFQFDPANQEADSYKEILAGFFVTDVIEVNTEPEMQKAASMASAFVLFFFPSCANFWPVYAQNLLILSIQHR